MGQPQNVFYRNWTLSTTKVCELHLELFALLLCESTRNVFEKQRKKLSVNYVLKLKTCPKSCVFEPSNFKLFEKSKLTQPLGLRVLRLFENSKIDLGVVDDITVSDLGVNLNPTSVCL